MAEIKGPRLPEPLQSPRKVLAAKELRPFFVAYTDDDGRTKEAIAMYLPNSKDGKPVLIFLQTGDAVRELKRAPEFVEQYVAKQTSRAASPKPSTEIEIEDEEETSAP